MIDQVECEMESLRDSFKQLLSLEAKVSKMGPVRPYILWWLNSVVLYRLAELCDFQKRTKKLTVDPRDARQPGLNAYHDYLTKVACLDLKSVVPSINHLRRVHNLLKYIAHAGGSFPEQHQRELETIDGIHFDGLLIVISDGFIWESVDHAKKYLQAVTRA